ncbi:MAG: transposase zinc-binding domain-containing protein [Methylococcales bacterium]
MRNPGAGSFARARCTGCGYDFLIAFSCKGRGICPSCNTRRMGQKRLRTWLMRSSHRSRCANGCWHFPNVCGISSAVMPIGSIASYRFF